MLNAEPCPIMFRPRRQRALPAKGQRVVVAVHKTAELWQGRRRVRYSEGEVFVGAVTAVGEDGLLDLQILGGQPMRLHARDAAFSIEPYDG
jgi:hypothetical protein